MARKILFLSFLILFLIASNIFAAGVIQLPQTGQTCRGMAAPSPDSSGAGD
ncbi:MAG: hypothetical protein HY757_03845 [Nitrospirae bacterium]|nr:hypothetical protein [Nitrospirota bacterium]